MNNVQPVSPRQHWEMFQKFGMLNGGRALLQKGAMVDFDYTDRSHLEAAGEILGNRPSPIQFSLKPPFVNVRTMISAILAEQYVKEALNK